MPTRICPNCNKKVSTSRLSCPHCDYKFNTKVCPDCLEEVDLSLKECPTCGYYFFNTNPSIIGGVTSNEEKNNIKVEESQSKNKNEKAAEFLICPQCGSSNIKMVSSTEGYCLYCHTKVYKKQETNINTKNITIIKQGKDTSIYENKYRVNPEVSKEYIMKLMLEQLVKEDAPKSAFNFSFSALKSENILFIESDKGYEVSFQARVGLDKKEPYIDYEYYYENVPVRSSNGTVTTQSVRKERPVTKYRSYIDWSPIGGNTKANTVSFTSNEEKFDHYRKMAQKGLNSINESSLQKINDEFLMSDYATKNIELQEKNKIKAYIFTSLNGDHIDDIEFEITSKTEVEDIYYLTPLYSLSIECNGKTYTKYAFPFGDEISINGDEIFNEDSVLKYKENKYKEKDKKVNLIKKDTLKIIKINNILTSLGYISYFVLVIVLINLVNNSTFTTVISFVSLFILICAVIYLSIFKKKKNNISETKINEVIKETEDNILDYESERENSLQTILENKLEEFKIKNVID